MNILACRAPYTKGGILSGEVKLNGSARDERFFKRVSSYVMQDDALYAHQSVRETLLFTAMLQLPAAMPLTEKSSRVESIIRELGLAKV